MITAVQSIATLSTTLFAGASIYINFVEHPARMGCDTKTATTVWAPSYKRATVMQASLAIIGFLSGIAVVLLGASDGSHAVQCALCRINSRNHGWPHARLAAP